MSLAAEIKEIVVEGVSSVLQHSEFKTWLVGISAGLAILVGEGIYAYNW